MNNCIVKKIDFLVICIRKINLVMGYIGMATLTIIALIIMYEVLMRYMFNSPTKWVLETSMMLQVCLAIIPSAYGLMEDSHVIMGAVVEQVKKETKNVFIMINSILGAVGCGFLTYLTWLTAKASITIKESLEITGLPIYPFKITVVIGFALLTLQFIVRFWDYYRTSKEKN